MPDKNATTNQVKKLHLEAVVLFAINNIPQVEPNTLKRFLELVNADGSFGTISHDQILTKMSQVRKYIPESCARSLLILMDLLEISPPEHFLLPPARAQLPNSDRGQTKAIPLVLETPEQVALRPDGMFEPA